MNKAKAAKMFEEHAMAKVVGFDPNTFQRDYFDLRKCIIECMQKAADYGRKNRPKNRYQYLPEVRRAILADWQFYCSEFKIGRKTLYNWLKGSEFTPAYSYKFLVCVCERLKVDFIENLLCYDGE